MANRMLNLHAGRRNQRGAAMLEMAIVLPLFLALVFGILEFGVAVFNWSLVVEATRSGARYAIVNNEECVGVTGDEGMVCPGAEPVSCQVATDSPMLVEMRKVRPTLVEENVFVTYECSDAGFDERPRPVLQVTVETRNIEYAFILPALLGIEATVSMPAFSTTRVSEDMYTTPE